jgi:hypothetical protein
MTTLVLLMIFLVLVAWSNADLTVTATQVLPSTGARYIYGVAGEALTAGEPVYKKAADGLYWKCDADAEASADCKGVAYTAVAAGQPVVIQYDGQITLGAGAAPADGETYFVSDTAGGLKPDADLGSGEYVTYVGYGIGSNKLQLDIKATGNAHA